MGSIPGPGSKIPHATGCSDYWRPHAPEATLHQQRELPPPRNSWEGLQHGNKDPAGQNKEIQGLNSFLKNNLKNEVFRKFSSEETKKPSEISVLTLQQGSNYLPLFSLFPGTLLHFHLPPAVCSLHPQDTAFFKALHSRPSPIVCTLNLSLHAAFRTDYITHSPR